MARLGKPIPELALRDSIIKNCAGSLVYDRACKTWMCKSPSGDFQPVSEKQVCLFFMQIGVHRGVNRFQRALRKRLESKEMR
jgi:hypothetical protein